MADEESHLVLMDGPWEMTKHFYDDIKFIVHFMEDNLYS